MDDFRILTAADSALVVEFGDAIDRATSDRVLALADTLRRARVPGATEITAAFRSLSVSYDSLATTGREVERAIRALMDAPRGAAQARRLFDIPVCYEAAHAPDLDEVAKAAALSTAEVVRLHAGARYHVYMVGFVPGFSYLGDVPEVLQLPRRRDPRTRVPAGSLGIATSMTGVYPYESPGGWHLIGACPVPFFDPESERGALLAPGDAVNFRPVTAGEFARIKEAVARRAFVVPSTEMGA